MFNSCPLINYGSTVVHIMIYKTNIKTPFRVFPVNLTELMLFKSYTHSFKSAFIFKKFKFQNSSYKFGNFRVS